MKNSFCIFLLLCLGAFQRASGQGSWSTVTNFAPHFNAGVMLLMTDGTILCKTSSGGSGQGTVWDKLTPDAHGSYLNGTWTSVTPMADDRLYFSSQVLADGRVYVAGGEYGSGSSKGEVYNPLTNTWTATPILSHQLISDANSEIISSGKVLQATVVDTVGGTPFLSLNSYLWDPGTNTYAAGPSMHGTANESAWVKLPDGSVLYVDRLSTNSERYIPSSNTWVTDASVPVGLYDPYGDEAGAAFMLPNGKAFFIGSTSTTAIYTPSGTSSPGSWTAGAAIPGGQGAPDAAAAMMVNGNILMALSPTARSSNHFPDSIAFYEYNYSTNSFTLTGTPLGGTLISGDPTFITNMLCLPDGNILFSFQGDDQYFLYTPGSAALAAGQPTVSNVLRVNCDTFTAIGTLFNGITEGAAYGDDWQMSSNYPMVRLTQGTNVYYARTYSWNRIGAVQTGVLPDTVQFVLPSGLPSGNFSLQVVANGNPSTNFSFDPDLTITPSATTMCVSGTATMTDAWPGGTWTSSNTSVATVGSLTGVVTGAGAGTANITYTYSGGCFSTVAVTVIASPSAITGTTSICTGGSSTLSSSPGGGTWTSNNTTVATIGSSTGIMFGAGAGSTTITYSISTCFVTAPVTVSNISAITGTATLCAGTTTPLSDGTPGGTWSSSNTTVANVGSSSGVVSGVSGGTATITYSTSAGCFVTQVVTVNTAPAAISGTTGLCVGATSTLSTSPSGGTWISDNTVVATIGSSTGTVNAVSTGSAGITYTLSDGCFNSVTVNVTTGVGPITGASNVCVGATTPLSDAGGGTWTTSNTSVATVGSSTGVVSGVSSGTVTISYSLGSGCLATAPFTVNASPSAVTGITTLCTSSTTTLNSTPAGGTWTSDNTAVATVGSTTGVVSGAAIGSAGITYTLPAGGCFAAATVNVTTAPGPITGTTTLCAGTTTPLSDAPGGGVWSSGNTAVATVGSSSGVVTGVSGGTASIVYSLGAGCTASTTVTVNAGPTAITGGLSVCASLTTTLNSTPSGGTWTSANTAVATIGSSTGVVSGASIGTSAISYTLGNGCAVGATVTVNSSAGAITGLPGICTGFTTTLSDPASGGTWTSSNTSIATIGSSTGIVSGVAPGTTVITYSVGAGCSATETFSVHPIPAIVSVIGGGSYCAGGTGVNVGVSGSAVGINYQLMLGGSPVGSAVPGVGGTLYFGLQTVAGTYTVIAEDPVTLCASNMAGSAVISISPTPNVYNVLGGGSYCAGGSGVLVGLSNSDVGINYQLYRGGSPLVGTTTAGTGAAITFGLQTTAGIYTVVATNASTTCSATMNGSVSVSINPLPTAYTVTGGGAYCTGTSGVAIGLSNSDIGVNYQLKRGATLVGAPVPGTGSAISFGLQTVASVYTVVATNTTTGCTNNMTGGVSVSLSALPTVYSVTGGGSFCSGGAGVAVGLAASNYGINYQLFRGGSPVGGPVAGTGSAISFGNQTVAGSYTVFGTNATTGCTSNMAGSVNVVVNPLPNVYSVTGGGSYCAGGTGVHVGLSNSDAGVNYQLMRAGASVGSPVAGTGVALDFGLQTTTGTYAVVATNASTGCVANMSGSVAISINPLPTVYNVIGGGNYCPGGSGVHVGLSNSALGVNYQLYVGASTVGAPLAGTGSGLDFGLQTTVGAYSVKATDATTGCSNNMSGVANVGISTVPAAFTVTGGGGYCSGGTGVAVGLSGSATSVNYQLFRGATPVGSALPGTGASLNFGLQTVAGTYTVVATGTLTGCTSNMTGSATVTINALPTAFSVTGGGAYCTGGTGVNISLASSQAGVNYQLYRGGTAVGSAVAGTGGVISFGLQTITSTYTVTAVNTSTGCTNTMAGSVSVSINPAPTLVAVTGGGSYCTGGTGLHVGTAASVVGTNYQLYNGASTVGGPLAGTGSALDFGLQTAAGTYTVIATIVATGCTNTMSGSAVIVVNPLPAAFTVTGGGSFCAGGTGVVVGLSGSTSGISYQLYNGGVLTGVAVAGTGAAITFGPQTVAGTYTVVAKNASTTCTNTMTGSATIVISPAPSAYTVTGGGAYCSGGTGVHIGLATSDIGVSYQLLFGGSSIGSPVAGTGSAIDFGLYTSIGTYTVKGTNTSTGCTGSMTGSVSVSVNPIPYTFTVTGGGSFCSGGSGVHVGLSGSVSGTNYQLMRGATLVGSPLAGTGTTLDFGLQTVAGTYTVVAINATTGCTNTMTGSATITISGGPATYTVTGGGSYCSGGIGVHIGLSGSASGVMYQLYRGASAVGSPLSGTGSALDFGAQTVGGTYTVTATSGGCSASMTGSATVVVNALPTVYTVTGGGGFCTGGSGVHIGLSNSDVGINYQLLLGASPVGSPLAGTGAALDFGLITTSGTYTVIATNTTTSCSVNMSGSAVVSSTASPLAYTVTGGGSYCPGGSGVSIGLSGSQSGVNYQLYVGGVPTGTPLAGTGSALNFGLHTAGTYTVIGTYSGSSCSTNMTGSATVTANPAPIVDTVTGGGATCAAGPGVHIGLNTSSTGISYQLYLSGSGIGSPLAGTGSALDFGLFVTGGTYTVIATGSSCSSTMYGSAIVTVSPSPAVIAMTGGGGFCSGGSGVHVGLAASATGVNYQLYLGGIAVGSPVPGIGAALDFGLETTGGTYTATGTYAGTSCSSNMSGSAGVTVYPLPTVDTVTGGGGYCSGGTGVHVGLNTSTSGVTYKLYASGTPVYSTTGTGSALDFGLYTTAATYTATAIAAVTACTDNMYGSAVISINPNPTVSGTIYTLMPSATITLTGSITGGSWTSSNTSVATINPSTGVVTGVALGTCTMTYTLPTGCFGVHNVSVTPTGFRSSNNTTAVVGETALSVVPNPNHGAFTVRGTLATTDDQDVSFEVTNMLGQVIYSGKVLVKNGELNQAIQLSGATANGMYLLSVRTDSEHKVFHVVVEQ